MSAAAKSLESKIQIQKALLQRMEQQMSKFKAGDTKGSGRQPRCKFSRIRAYYVNTHVTHNTCHTSHTRCKFSRISLLCKLTDVFPRQKNQLWGRTIALTLEILLQLVGL